MATGKLTPLFSPHCHLPMRNTPQPWDAICVSLCGLKEAPTSAQILPNSLSLEHVSITSSCSNYRKKSSKWNLSHPIAPTILILEWLDPNSQISQIIYSGPLPDRTKSTISSMCYTYPTQPPFVQSHPLRGGHLSVTIYPVSTTKNILLNLLKLSIWIF